MAQEAQPRKCVAQDGPEEKIYAKWKVLCVCVFVWLEPDGCMRSPVAPGGRLQNVELINPMQV